MKTFVRAVMVLAMALIPASVFATTASAHVNTDHSADCNGVSLSFADFPDAVNTIKVQSAFGSADKTFEGTSGTVSATWAELNVPDVTVNTIQQYGASWTADGGGHTDIFSFDTTPCKTPPPPVDVCKDIDGNQTEVPEGHYQDGENCPPIQHVTVCRDGETVNLTIPPDSVEPGDTEGECPPPPVDVCPNLDGVQTSVPDGYILNDQGNCVEMPPTDVCPNLDGIQPTIPPGMVLDNGNCVEQPTVGPPTPPVVKTVVPPAQPAAPTPVTVTPQFTG